MTSELTVSIPVDQIVEVQNISGDTLCVNPRGKEGWHIQIVRGGQRHRRGGMQILGCDARDKLSLMAAINAFYSGDYGSFEEPDVKQSGRGGLILEMLGTVMISGIALIFLAFMISVFMKMSW